MYAKLHSTLTFMFQACACGDYKRKYYQVRSKFKTCTITIYYRELGGIHEKSHMEWNNLLCIKIIFVLLFIKVVSNKGLMKIRNIEISENFSTLLSGKCCSNLCKCNVIFQVCLTPYNFKQEICIIKAMSDSIVTPDSNEVDVTFSSTYSGAMSVVFRGIDQNSNINDNVVFKIADNKRLTFINSTWWQISTTVHDDVTISFQYKLSCKQHLYGPTCNKLCIPRNDRFGHYTCDNMGTPLCYPGWHGSYCTRRTCSSKCIHGECGTRMYQCICDHGWTGNSCNIRKDSCFINKCQNKGFCKKDGKCKCFEGYYGKFCEFIKYITSTKIRPSTTVLSLSLQSFTSKLSNINTPSLKTRTFSTPFKSITDRMRQTTSFHSDGVKSTITYQRSSTYDEIDVSQIIASTSWIRIPDSSSEVARNVTPPSTQGGGESNAIIISLSSILSFILITICLLVFLLVWKRAKYRVNKRQTTPLNKDSEYPDSLKSIPSGTSLNTVRSMLTPIINKCSDTDSGTGIDPPDLDMISVIDYPVHYLAKPSTENLEKYTLQAVDRMCWEAIRGSVPKSYDKINGSKKKRKTLQTSHEMLNKHFKVGKASSHGSSGYCSSGYNSCGNSPAPKSATSSRSRLSDGLSSENSFTSVLRLIHDITEQSTAINLNNNNDVDLMTSEENDKIEVLSTNSTESSDFNHNRHTFNHVTFEGLPNFICYNEDEKNVS